MSIDCSADAIAKRAADIAELDRKIMSGVVSVADRGRSVSYTNPQWLLGVRDRLAADQDYCLGRRPTRLLYVPLCKNL